MEKISIIVPIYNGQAYIKKCIQSLTSQTYSNIEILCIDDGSTDSSLDILTNLAQQDQRIIIIHQNNSGVSAARNTGLKAASGEYIMFCDMDDWYEPDMCLEMNKIIKKENVDLVVCNTNIIEKDDFNRDIRYFKNQFNKKQKLTLPIIQKMNVVLWNKIYKKSLIDKYKIKFPEKCENDDDCFFMQYISVSDSAYFLPFPLYNYVVHKGSLSEHVLTRNVQHLFDRLIALQNFFEFLQLNNLYDKQKDIFAWFLFLEYSCMIKNMHKPEISKLKKMILLKFGKKHISFIKNILKHRSDIYFFNILICKKRVQTVQINNHQLEWTLTSIYFNCFKKKKIFFIK